MKILAQTYQHYDYLNSSICQGLDLLDHDVYSLFPGTNYITKRYNREPLDLFVQFVATGSPMPGVRSVMVWGEDSHQGLADVFSRGFDAVFARDYIDGPGIAISFGIETRYLCATEKGLKPLSEREIDICFLGDLAGYKGNRLKFTERLREDFKSYNLELGPRKFNEPDEQWSRWTKPWCAHDPRYFETLANSKICLSFRGAGPDTGRTYESLASGAVCVIEDYAPARMFPASAHNIKIFYDYPQLCAQLMMILHDLKTWESHQQDAWKFNVEHHSTKARAAYFLEKLGY